MIVIFLILALVALAGATLSGPVYLLLRKSPFARYTPELAVALFPAFIVLTGSLLGYVRARDFNLAWQLAAVGAGLITSLVVGIRLRTELGAAVRSNGPRALLILGLAVAAGLIVIPRQIAENRLGYLEFMNGEFLSYAQLAVFSMGQQHSDLPSAFLAQHQSARDGTDFLNVALCRLTQATPADIVQVTSALLRLCYAVPVLLIIWEFRIRARHGLFLTSILLVGFVCWSPDVYAFQVSFMAANAAIGVFVLLLVLLFLADRIPLAPFLGLHCLGNLYLLVTYPEIMPFLKIAEAAFFFERCLTPGRNAAWWRLPAANLLVFLVNPGLVLRKIGFVRDLLAASAGWNFLGDPIGETPIYFQHLLGLKFNFVPAQTLPAPWLTLAILLSAGGLVFWSLGHLGRSLNTRIMWLVPLGLFWFHLAPFMATPDAGPRQFYGAGKFFLLWLWIVPLAVALALPAVRSRVTLTFLAIGLAGLVGANLRSLQEAVAFQRHLPTFYTPELRREVLGAVRARGAPVLISSEYSVVVWYWFQALDSAGLQPVVWSATQANLIARAPNALFVPVPPDLVQQGPFTLVQPTKTLWFSRGNIFELEESTAHFNQVTPSPLVAFPGKTIFGAPQVAVLEATVAPRPDSK